MAANLIGLVTGPGKTDKFTAAATDLGVMSVIANGSVIALFGDTFSDHAIGSNWRSPIGLRTNNRDLDANLIVWDDRPVGGGPYANKLLPYESGGSREVGQLPDGFTNIPCDMLWVPQLNKYIMTTFAVKTWNRTSAGSSWQTFHSRMWQSTEPNADKWDRTTAVDQPQFNFDFWNNGSVWSLFQNNTMFMWGEFIHFIGTNEGRWLNGGVHMARVHYSAVFDHNAYDFWGYYPGRGWDWGRWNAANPPLCTPLFRAGTGKRIGEVNAHVFNFAGTPVIMLAYTEERTGVCFRFALNPESVWTGQFPQLGHDKLNFQYAPAIHPYSNPLSGHFVISEWDGESPAPYCVHLAKYETIWPFNLSYPAKVREEMATLNPEESCVNRLGKLAPDFSLVDKADEYAFYDEHLSQDFNRDYLKDALLGKIDVPHITR